MTAPVVITPPDLGVDDNGEPIEPVFRSPLEFYEQFLSQMFVQDPDAKDAWCGGWRQHFAAEFSVWALWKAWELANVGDDAAMATYLAHQQNPIMRELLDGCTFAGCSADLHRPTTRPLP